MGSDKYEDFRTNEAFKPSELEFAKVIHGFAYKSEAVRNDIISNEVNYRSAQNPEYVFKICEPGLLDKYGSKHYTLKFIKK